MCIRRVSKPHTHITHMLRQCTGIVYLLKNVNFNAKNVKMFFIFIILCSSLTCGYSFNIHISSSVSVGLLFGRLNDLLSLMPLSAIFQLYHGYQF